MKQFLKFKKLIIYYKHDRHAEVYGGQLWSVCLEQGYF